MGCTSSREAVGGVVSPSAAPVERRRSLGMCRGGHDGVHAYAALPSEEPAVKGARRAPAPAAEEEALPGAEDAAATEENAASSWTTARWSALPAPSCLPLPPPEPLPALDLDPAAVLPGFRQPVQAPSPSSLTALLYPEQENPAPPEEAFDDDDVDMGTPAARDIPEVTDFVRARVAVDDVFHEKKLEEEEKKAAAVAGEEEAADVVVDGDGNGDDATAAPPRRRLPPRAAGKPVVLYLTSLRGVRRTFEDCRAVRAILRCYRVRLDERDVSMHAAFRSELRGLLAAAAGGGGGFEGCALPRVFLDGRHDLGGADDVRALHESGELARALALAGCECDAAAAGAAPAPAPAGRLGHACACAACGEARFVPCETCHGSCKVFVDDEGCRRLAGFFRQCPDCNENGLIRCPVCCY